MRVSKKIINGVEKVYLPVLAEHGKYEYRCQITRFRAAVSDDTTTYPMIYDITGKNLLDMSVGNIVVGKYINNSGKITNNENNYYNDKQISVVGGETYTLSISDSICYASVMEYNRNGTFIKRTLFGDGSQALSSLSITLDSNTASVLIGSNMYLSAITLDDILGVNWQFEIGSSPTPYEPYFPRAGKWKFVYDTVTEGFGYYNEKTGDYVPMDDATGTVIQPVEYLESHGDEYIDTGILGNQDTVIIAYLMSKTTQSGNHHPFGSYTDTSKAITWNININSGVLRFGNKSYSYPTRITDRIHQLKAANDGYYLDNSLIWEPKADDFTTEGTLYLLGAQGVTTARFVGVMSKVAIYDGAPLVRNYLPVRVNTLGYLLDTVEWKLYPNAGGGAFTYGEDKNYSLLNL